MSNPDANSRALRGDLTSGPIARHLVRLTVPMTWGIMAIISFQLVNTFYISLLGTKSLAAISFTYPVTFFLFSFIMGFGIAMSSVASRLIGQGRVEDVRRVTTHGLMLVASISIMIAVFGLAFMNPVFLAMGAPPDMLDLIDDYMTIWFAGALFISLPIVGNAAMRAGGDTLTPAIIMTIAALANVILDPILIFGLLGFPRLELQGAAISTVISNGCAVIASLYILYAREKMICGIFHLHMSEFFDSTKRILFIALPASVSMSIQPVVNAFIVSLLSVHGTEAVASYGVVTRIEAFAFIILMGLAVGMGPIIGQNFGARKFERVNETLRMAMAFNVLWSCFIAIVLAVFAEPIAELFSTDPAVIHYAVLFFWIVPLSYAPSNMVNGWGSAFNAMGFPQRSFGMVVIKTATLLPAVLLGNKLGGVMGILLAIAAVNIMVGIALHLWSWRACLATEKSMSTAAA